ncbi:MAG: protein kinase [Myxococcales bacterium]|jgi:serine/threonine protein kinase|nr:protein kinase [Myxococcales bacterium]
MDEVEQRRVGETLGGKYKLDALLGAGAMGAVYRATNVAIGRVVAIKVLRQEHSRTAEIVERFLREARAANIVRHPNVVDVLDIGRDDDGAPFIVQELLEGEDFSAFVQRHGGKVGVQTALDLILPVVEAVEFAHARGVVHRDLKPENVFLARQGSKIVPKLLDFGISQVRTPDKVRLTTSGSMMGTPAYMAPEQVRGNSDLADARTDVWALGVILFEIVSGQLPFAGETIPSMFVSIATTDAPDLRTVAPDAPAALAKVVERCLRRVPADRYPSACELARDLRALREGRPLEDTQLRSIPPPGVTPDLEPHGGPSIPRAPEAPSLDGRSDRAIPAAKTSERALAAASSQRMRARTPSSHDMPPVGGGMTFDDDVDPGPRLELDAPTRARGAPPMPITSASANAWQPPAHAAARAGPPPGRSAHAPAANDAAPLYGALALALVAILATGGIMAVGHRADGWDLRLWMSPLFDGHGNVAQIAAGAVGALAGGGLVAANLRGDDRKKSSFVVGAGLILAGIGLLLAGLHVFPSGQMAARGLALCPIGGGLRLIGAGQAMWAERKSVALGLGVGAAVGFFAAIELIMGAGQP